MQNSCTAKKHNNTSVRSIAHHKHKELFDAVKIEMLKTEFRKNLCERMWKLEGLMSEIKLRHNMHRAKYRGINKIQTQAYMAAYVINVKRLIAYIFILFHAYLRWYAKYVLPIFLDKKMVFQQSRSFVRDGNSTYADKRKVLLII